MRLECGLSVGSDDNDSADRFEKRWFVARVDVGRCEECPHLIAKGDRYERISLVTYRVRNRFRLCATCAEIAEAFCEFHMVGSLWEDMEEAFEDTPVTTGCYEKLSTAKARAKLQAAWIDWKGL